VLEDLRARLHATRWPDAPEDAGWSLGTDLGYLRELVAYWADEFDWPAQEAALARLPRFRVTLGGPGSTSCTPGRPCRPGGQLLPPENGGGVVPPVGAVDGVGDDELGDAAGVGDMDDPGDIDELGDIDVDGDADGEVVGAPIRPGSGFWLPGRAAKPSVFPAPST
jgi:hypothetical protein